MYSSDVGIVISKTRISDSKYIINLLTQDKGLCPFIFYGGSRKSRKSKINIFQPLSIVNIDSKSSSAKISVISTASLQEPFRSIPYEITKSSICLFVSEFLSRILIEADHDRNIYDFVLNFVKLLDDNTTNVAYFPQLFLIKFTKPLGIYPQGAQTDKLPYLNIEKGVYCSEYNKENTLTKEISKAFSILYGTNFDSILGLSMTKFQRTEMLVSLLNYYRFHTSNFKSLNSHRILEDILS